MIIAIDGTVASGKSTAARNIAGRLGFLHINTGLMYRAVAAFARRNGIPTADAHRVAACAKELRIDLARTSAGQRVYVDGTDMTDEATAPDIGPDVSNVADNEAVRAVLVREQRRMGLEAGDAVLEGRDIGSVVFPDAEVKFFVTADARERARRRLEDDRKRNPDITLDDVLEAIIARDERDRSRPVGALKRMPGAIDVDTTHNTPEQTLEQMLAAIGRMRMGRSS
ncbi:(d)CMP kinase [bacterium]|nr:(d)CMP kinase [bacterium]